MRIALHTRVRAGRITDYERAHQEVPAELTAAIRAAGAHRWTIWRSGHDLFHLLEVDDYNRLVQELGAQPANAAWQVRMAELVDGARDHAAGEADDPMRVVWRLPTDTAIGRPAALSHAGSNSTGMDRGTTPSAAPPTSA